MLLQSVYDAGLALVQGATAGESAFQFTDDMGHTYPAALVESDTVPPLSGDPVATIAWSMFPTDAEPIENPRMAPWRMKGWVQVHILVPSSLGPRGRIGLVNAISDTYRAASPNAHGIEYGEQSATAPTNDPGVYGVTTLLIAYWYDEPAISPA